MLRTIQDVFWTGLKVRNLALYPAELWAEDILKIL